MRGTGPEALTEDRLLGGRVTIRQPKRGFRVAVDSVLLAAAVPAGDGDRVLDLGAGVGGAALMLAARVPGCRLVGLEIQPDLVGVARENVRLNGMEERVDMVEGDLARPPSCLAPGGFDHVMMNPPYHAPGRADAPADAGRAASRIEGAAGLDRWIAFAVRMLRRKGMLTLVHRSDRLADVLAALSGLAGGIVIFPLWPHRGGPAKRIIVRAHPGDGSPLRLARGLVLHREGGGFTPEADRVLRGEALDL